MFWNRITNVKTVFRGHWISWARPPSGCPFLYIYLLEVFGGSGAYVTTLLRRVVNVIHFYMFRAIPEN